MPTNRAAWQTAPKSNPLDVKSAPYTSPRENEIVIKNAAVAINPLDWIIQDLGKFMFSWLKYPFILGVDTAGAVVEVGPGVTRFKVGDRVLGHANGSDQNYNSPAHGAFQLYTVLLVNATSPIPDHLSYERASVLPLGLSTAASGLFQKDQLALQHPSIPPPKPTGKTLLIWGGSTSVGCNAIQLAVAAGYGVITTCSPKNFAYVRTLGASQAFDYNSKTIITDLIHAFDGKTTAGALSIGHRAAENCLDVLNKCTGDKFLSMATYPVPQSLPKNFIVPTMAATYITGVTNIWLKSKTRGIRTNFIFGSTCLYNEVGKAIYVDFLPRALAGGAYVAAPEPYVVGKGLESIQLGYDIQRKGVSAKKVVISL